MSATRNVLLNRTRDSHGKDAQEQAKKRIPVTAAERFFREVAMAQKAVTRDMHAMLFGANPRRSRSREVWEEDVMGEIVDVPPDQSPPLALLDVQPGQIIHVSSSRGSILPIAETWTINESPPTLAQHLRFRPEA